MNVIELAEKKIVDLIKSNLEILKSVEDEKVKAVIAELEVSIGEYDTALEPALVEPVVEPEVKEEPVKEEPEAEKEPVAKEEPVVEPEPEAEPVVPELSLKIASKLKEAAYALEQKELELKAKDEIIQGFKNKINSLELLKEKTVNELNIYKKKESLELTRQKEALTNELLSLYLELGIKKTAEELGEFTTAQMLELQQALSLTVDKKNTSVRETVHQHASVKNISGDKRSKKLSMEDEFIGLFPGIDNY